MIIVPCSFHDMMVQKKWGLLGKLVYDYYHGTTYTHVFNSTDDPRIDQMNCTADLYSHESLDNKGFKYQCFEQFKILAILTMVIMVLPGILLSIFLAIGLNKMSSKIPLVICIALSPFIWTTFPILLFLCKVTIDLALYSTFKKLILKPNYFKKQCSLSSFLLT